MAKILIVEDDTDLVETYTDLLEAHHHTVTCVDNANEARDLVKQLEPAIVFLDLNLVGYPGTILIRTIRDYEALQNTKIVVITGHPEMLEYHKDIARVDLVLTKPIANEQLLATVNQFAPEGY